MSTALTTRQQDDALAFLDQPSPEALQAALAEGQLQKLSTEQRLKFLAATCRSLGLNPLSRPFEFITLQGKITMYARKDATDQLRKIHNVSVKIVSREQVGDVLIVTARASMPNGREDESIGAVPFGNLRGEAAAMAAMKAETKAKRRVTLSICGLGFIDESEVADAQAAQHQHQGGDGLTMPQGSRVMPKDEPEPSPESPAIEAEIVQPEAKEPSEDEMVFNDFMQGLREIERAEDLTRSAGQCNELATPAMVKTAKAAVMARAKELGLTWNKTANRFEEVSA